MAKPVEITPQEQALTEAQALLQHWIKTKSYLAKALSDEPITREEEMAFLTTKTEIGKYQKSVSMKLPPGVTLGPDKLQEILRQAISISHLRSLPKNDRNLLITNWHYVFVHISQAFGCLQFVAQGWTPRPRVMKQGTALSDLKGAAAHSGDVKKSKKKGVMKQAWVWILFVILVAATFYFRLR